MLSKYRLPNQLENEEIVMVVRMDFFVLFMKILFFILLIIIPLGFFALITIVNPQFLYGQISSAVMLLGTSMYYLFACLFFFFSFIDYYLDVWLITNERIIDIQQKGFFSRIISEQKLFRIQDVTSEVEGVIPTLLKFGDVHVQTADTKERFFFNDVPNPDEIRDTIIKLVRLNQQKHKDEMVAEVLPPEDILVNKGVDAVMKH